MGRDNMGGNSAERVAHSAADSLGGNAGEETHQLSMDELPSRNAYSGHTNRGHGQSGGPFSYVNHVNTDTIGDDQPHNNMPPYLSLNYIIKY
jgi:microcystin-dependent protein